jgi:two-component flavin-dependent monooxygenase/oxygenase LndZ5
MSTAGLSAAAAGVPAIAGRCADAAVRGHEVRPSVMASVLPAGFARHCAPAAPGGREGRSGQRHGAVRRATPNPNSKARSGVNE